jgi:hypothetical protein
MSIDRWQEAKKLIVEAGGRSHVPLASIPVLGGHGNSPSEPGQEEAYSRGRKSAPIVMEELRIALEALGLRYRKMGVVDSYSKTRADKGDVKKVMGILTKAGLGGEHIEEKYNEWLWGHRKIRGLYATIRLHEDGALIVSIQKT